METVLAGPIVGATTQGRMATTRRWHVLVQALAQPRAGEARPDTTVDLPISTKTTPKPSRRPNSAIPKPSVPVCDSAQLTPRPVTTATTGRLRQLRPVTISRAQDEPDRNAPEANVGRGRETRADGGTDQVLGACVCPGQHQAEVREISHRRPPCPVYPQPEDKGQPDYPFYSSGDDDPVRVRRRAAQA